MGDRGAAAEETDLGSLPVTDLVGYRRLDMCGSR